MFYKKEFQNILDATVSIDHQVQDIHNGAEDFGLIAMGTIMFPQVVPNIAY